MDIGADLFYNGNTVHSGNFLKGGRPGKETMRYKENFIFVRKKLFEAASIGLCMLCLLCGCTKKEEVVLLAEDTHGQVGVQSGLEQTVEMAGTDGNPGQTMSEDIAADNSGAESDGHTGASAYIVKEPGSIFVHVCGAVMAPGVYELTPGSRVYEAVRAAGGFSEDAEENYVNQAQELPDGVKLVIPTKEEAEHIRQEGTVSQEADAKADTSEGESGQTVPGSNMQIGIVAQGSVQMAGDSSGAGTAQTNEGRININTASVEELCRIPGIGATRAAAVVSYRESHGAFKSPEDIMQVSGIKEGTYEKIKDSISVK